jgi:hypothetical protein
LEVLPSHPLSDRVNDVADRHSPLSSDKAELTDETIAADLYPGVRYLAKVVDVQFGVMHYKTVVTDLNTPGQACR